MIGMLARAAEDPNTKVVIYTGADPYFCAGGSLAELFASAR